MDYIVYASPLLPILGTAGSGSPYLRSQRVLGHPNFVSRVRKSRSGFADAGPEVFQCVPDGVPRFSERRYKIKREE